MTVIFRPAIAEDRMFIVSGWSSSLRMTRDIPLIRMSRHAEVFHPEIEAAIDRPAVVSIVAAGAVLQGFICAEPGYVFYVYVAQPFRGNGLARQLFAAVRIDPGSRFGYAARTKASWECHQAGKIPQAKYDPFHARFPSDEHHRDCDTCRRVEGTR